MFRSAVRRVWRRKWEAIVAILGILISLVVQPPGVGVVQLWLGLVALLILEIGQDLRSTYQLLREKHLPMMVMAGVGDERSRAMVHDALAVMQEWGFDERTFTDDFNVQREDWLVRRTRDLPVRRRPWEELVDSFESKVNALAARLEGLEVFHLFLNCPSVLAMGLGAVLRTNHLVVLHHYADSEYTPVIDFYASRQEVPTGLGQLAMPAAKPFRYIEVLEPEQFSPHLYVALQLAGHDPRGDVERLAREAGTGVVHIRNTYDNRLTEADDWLLAAREVVTVLLGLVARPEVERLHLFVSSPVVLAAAIGMGLGTRSPITVHHWFADRHEYRDIFDLEKL